MKGSCLRRSLLLLSLILLAVLLWITLSYEEPACVKSLRFVPENGNAQEKIALFKARDKQYYLFLPSYADPERIIIEYDQEYSVYIDGVSCSDDHIVSRLDADGNEKHTLVIKNRFGIKLFEKPLYILQDRNIPALSLHLSSRSIDKINRERDKDNADSGICSLIGADGSLDYEGSFAGIHGRGNTTWNRPKKPYVLSFPDKVNLLEMGENMSWILLSNVYDESNLRNKLAYDFAAEAGLPYSVHSEFVDLYIDDEYYGLYLLTEKVEITDSRISLSDLYASTRAENIRDLEAYGSVSLEKNGIFQKCSLIPNDPSDITGGYLLEFDIEERIRQAKASFTTGAGQGISLKYPQTVSVQEMDYISTLFQQIEDDIANDTIPNNIDMSSWVRFYLIKEILGNYEPSSIFFYKDSDLTDEKVYAGPIWDYDFSLGTKWCTGDMPPDEFCFNTWGWFQKLYHNAVFREALEQVYKEELREKLETLISEKIDENAEKIFQSYRMNELRWEEIQKLLLLGCDTLEEHTEYLKKYLTDRMAFLDNEWIFHSSDSASVLEEDTRTEDRQTNEGGFEYKVIVSLCSLAGIAVLSTVLFVYDIRRNKGRNRTE